MGFSACFQSWGPRYFLILEYTNSGELGGTIEMDTHLSRYVHKQVFDKSITSLEARVILVVLRYAFCRLINLRQIQGSSRLPEEKKLLDECLKGVKNENVE